MVPVWSFSWMHNRPLLALLTLCLPLTLLWTAALLHCLRACLRDGHLGSGPRPAQPGPAGLSLDPPSWLLLLLLTGWLGGVAYVTVLLLETRISIRWLNSAALLRRRF